MTIGLAPVLTTLFQDDFANDPSGPVSPAKWSEPTGAAEFIPPAGGFGYQGTETQPDPPVVDSGRLRLELQTYNPTGNPQGQSFQGAAIYTNQSFTANTRGQGIAFTAVAKLSSTVPGMVGGIFAYGLNGATGLHDEIDFESLSDFAATSPAQEQTNIYLNQPANSPGNPLLVSDPGLTTYHTYTMEWFPNEVLWFIDATLVRQSTVYVPRSAMQFYLNIWAYDAGASLRPAATAASNQIYTFDVRSASVSVVKDVNSTLLVNGTTANQVTTDATSMTPFKGVAVSDANPGQTDIVTVTLSNAANGILSGAGTFSTGVYTFSGPAAEVSADLNNLVFTPTKHQAPGETVATTFTISVTDSAGASAFDDVTSVLTAQAGAGLIGELSISQQLELIYIAYFDRSADNAGLAYWTTQYTQALKSGQGISVALSNVANSFAPQPETIVLYPILGTPNPDLSTQAARTAVNAFVDSVYFNMFGHHADMPGLNYWVPQITTRAVGLGAAALAIGNGATGNDATELLNKITVALDFTTRTATAGLGTSPPYPSSFLTAARNVLSGVDGTALNDPSVTTGEAATTSYIASASTGHQNSVLATPSGDPSVITVTGSGQTVDPGSGGHTIAFLAGTSADTLMSHTEDIVSGCDPATDVLDLRALLSEANVDLHGDIASLNNYLTITHQGSSALLTFDPTGHGGGSVVAILDGLESTTTDLNMLAANGALRIA